MDLLVFSEDPATHFCLVLILCDSYDSTRRNLILPDLRPLCVRSTVCILHTTSTSTVTKDSISKHKGSGPRSVGKGDAKFNLYSIL